ncbi:MAG: GNAT family N-acetyltransferase [Geminicoccaceae bacterium]
MSSPAPAGEVCDIRARDLVRGDLPAPLGSLFSSPAWIAMLEATYGFEVRASTLVADGRCVAAIPYAVVDDIRGRRVLSLPFSDYCDPLVGDAAAWERLVAPLRRLGAPLRLRCLRNSLPLADGHLAKTGEALWHGVDLRRDEEAIWAGLDPSARQNVRRAQRAGVRIREGRSLDDLAAFHAMHRHVRKAKYRLLAQPFRMLEAMHDAFGERVRVLLAEIDGRPVAGILFLIDADTLFYKFNASVELPQRPNDLLAWEGLRLGRRLGLGLFDFGLSDPAQPGLVRYKRKFATEERVISLLQHVPVGYTDPRGAEVSKVLQRMTQLLTDPEVPDAITRQAGDELYRFFA